MKLPTYLKNTQNKAKYIMQIILSLFLLIAAAFYEASLCGTLASFALLFKCLNETHLLIDFEEDEDEDFDV